MSDLVVHPQAAPLRGYVPAPADKSIAHRAILLSAIARGRSRIVAPRMGDDNRSSLAATRALGAKSELVDGVIEVEGVGLSGLIEPSAELDCGNSGTTMRLLTGLLAAMPFRTRLVGDASLSRRPMARVVAPLRLRGARIEGKLDPARPGSLRAPLEIGPLPPPNVLSELAYELPVPSAQVKSALLLSGLYSPGDTTVSEPVISRDHTERMLASLGVPLTRVGGIVRLEAARFSGELPGFELEIPGDPSAAAFLIAAGVLVPGSEVGVRGLCLNPTRTGFYDLLRQLGAEVVMRSSGDALGEPIGDVAASFGELRGLGIGGEVVVRAIDELPILLGVAARAHGVTVLEGAAELRVKESDRLSAMAQVLRAFGVACEERPDGLVVEGRPGAPLDAGDVDARGDHRIAMTAAVLGLVAGGPSRVRGVDAIATSFPRFVGSLRALGARIDVV